MELEKKKTNDYGYGQKLIAKERKRWLFFGIPWTFTKYTLTDKKLIIQEGLLKSIENEILLYRVIDVTYSRNLMQKIFKLGTIMVYSKDKSTPTLVIKNIKNSRHFREELSSAVENDKQKRRVRQNEVIESGSEFDSDYSDHYDGRDYFDE